MGSSSIIVQYLRSRRIELRLTINQVAKMVGVQGPHLNRWELGRTEPGITKVERWAAALGWRIIPPVPVEEQARNLAGMQFDGEVIGDAK